MFNAPSDDQAASVMSIGPPWAAADNNADDDDCNDDDDGFPHSIKPTSVIVC